METVRTVSRRVDRLESALIRLTEKVEVLSDNMDDFREDMVAYRRRSEQQMFEADQRFEEWMQKMDTEIKRHNLEIGQISNKMGTMVEDLIMPSIGRILKQVINCSEEPSRVIVRKNVRMGGRTKEYDGLVVCGDYLLICEAKGTLKPQHIDEFKEHLTEARTFLPEYKHLKIVGALGTLHIDPSLVVRGEREGLIMLATGMELMDILNQDGFIPHAF